MNLYLEIFGYFGTLLIIVSMMMSSVTKLRVINMCGSAVSAVYAVLTATYPIVVLNLFLIAVNLYKLLRERGHGRDADGGESREERPKDGTAITGNTEKETVK